MIVGLAAATAAVGGDLAFGLRGHHHPPPPAGAPTGAAPADASWRAAAADEQTLIDAYETATRDHPSLAATLALPLSHHRAHLAALTRAPAPSTSVPPTTTSSGPPPDAASVAARRDALAALRGREAAAAGRRSVAAVQDLGGGTLLARIAAAEAVHADYLAAAITDLQPPAPRTSAAPPLSTAARHGSTSAATTTR